MNKVTKTILLIATALVAAGCAKAPKVGENDANERYFNAWMEVNYPDLRPSGLGIYVIEEEAGTGVEVKEDGFVIADYTITDLNGNISSYTSKEIAKQLGKYDTTAYYGPQVITTIESTIQAGLADAMIGMRAGGRKKVIIPSWLMTYKSYDSPEDYIKNSSSGTSAIYDITIRDFADSINNYEIAQIEKYIKANPETFNNRIVNDTTGFYYQPVEIGNASEKFENDTTIYINYTGRLLNGLVFDTTDEKIAKDNGIYSPSRTYKPSQINWGEKYTDITMGSSKSSVIPGFALTLWHMNPMGKGIGVFYSALGYNYNGSGASIPAYAPLIFEIEIVEEPED